MKILLMMLLLSVGIQAKEYKCFEENVRGHHFVDITTHENGGVVLTHTSNAQVLGFYTGQAVEEDQAEFSLNKEDVYEIVNRSTGKTYELKIQTLTFFPRAIGRVPNIGCRTRVCDNNSLGFKKVKAILDFGDKIESFTCNN